MSDQNQAVVNAAPAATQVAPAKPWNMTPSNMGEALKYADMLATSGLVPKAYINNPGAVLVAVQMGQEVGLAPMQAIQNIAVINNHPSIWGDALPALAKRNPDYEYLHTTWDEATMTATCRGKRKNEPEQIQTFSWTDAERAGLAKKDTYKNYPQRMCQVRARSWVIRDVFPDSLKGLYVAEEAFDIPADDYHVVPTDEDLAAAKPVDGMDGLAAKMAEQSEQQQPESTVIVDGGVAVDDTTGEILVDVVALKQRMDTAADVTELEQVGLEFNALQSGEIKSALRKHYRKNLDRLLAATSENEGNEADGSDEKGETAGDTSDA